MTERSLQYRPYLDGLRGIAVLLVFVFHAARAGLPGGFIGVDVFFVLSGYLITRILISQHAKTGRIRVADFYARRIRRLMPAVILVVLVVVMREVLWGDLLELASRLRDAIATLFYVENWNLISQTDQYFQESVSASPLRHAWSLSIEEQFYLLWPVLLIPILAFGRKHRTGSMLVVAAMTVLSVIVMAMLFEPGLVTRAYYGTDARVHQPLLGAVLAFLMVRSKSDESGEPNKQYLWPILAGASFVGLIVAARVFTGATPAYYRGGSLAVGVLTVILILALERTPTGWPARSLGWNPLKQLGRISYGFYLWHWPIILWLTVPEGFSFWERRVVNLAQFGLTLAISIASFVMMENPIREGSVRLGRLKAPATIAVGLTTLVAAGAFTFAVLAPDRTAPIVAAPEPDTTQETGDDTTPPTEIELAALAATAMADRSFEPCPEDPRPCVKVEGATPDSPTVVLIGDSTAQSYDPALKELARTYGFRYVQAAVGGCPISHRLLATGTDGELHKPSNFMCFEELPGIYEMVVEQYKPSLIIATSWNEKNQHVIDGQLLESGTEEHISSTETALRDSVEFLTSDGANLAFVDILPPGMTVDCLESGGPDSSACTRSVTPSSGEAPYNGLFHLLDSQLPEVIAISLEDVICPNESCPLVIDNVVMRYDGHHFTATASRSMAQAIDQRLQEAGVVLSELGQQTAS